MTFLFEIQPFHPKDSALKENISLSYHPMLHFVNSDMNSKIKEMAALDFLFFLLILTCISLINLSLG